MILDDLSYDKIQAKLNSLDSEIRKLTTERETLDRYYKVKEQFDIQKARCGKALETAQDKKAILWMRKYPWLTLSKGAKSVQIAVCRYSDPKSENRFDSPDAIALYESGEQARMETYLKDFCKGEIKEPEAPKPEQPKEQEQTFNMADVVSTPAVSGIVIDRDEE